MKIFGKLIKQIQDNLIDSSLSLSWWDKPRVKKIVRIIDSLEDLDMDIGSEELVGERERIIEFLKSLLQDYKKGTSEVKNSTSAEQLNEWIKNFATKYTEQCLHQNAMVADLHTHSAVSDGYDRPESVIDVAEQKGAKTIALVDHDIVCDLDELEKYAKKKGIKLIKGVEFSCEFNSTKVDILAYGVDVKNKDFVKYQHNILKARKEYIERSVNNLKSTGYDISFGDIEQRMRLGSKFYNAGSVINTLIDKKYASDKKQAIKILESLPKNVLDFRLEVKEAIDLCLNMGGISVFAHPFEYCESNEKVERFVKLFKGYGLQGIEVYYSSFSPEQVRFCQYLAKKYDLLITGGSDYHGLNRKGTGILDAGLMEHQLKTFVDKIN